MLDRLGNAVRVDLERGALFRLDRALEPVSELPLPVRRVDDFLVTEAGGLVLLDARADRLIAVIEPSGSLAATLPLEAEEAIVAIDVDGEDILVLGADGRWFRTGFLDGGLDGGRRVLPGRPTRDGARFLDAWVSDEAQGVQLFTVDRETGEDRLRALPRPAVGRLFLADADASGAIHLVAEVAQPSGPRVVLRCLDRDGNELGGGALEGLEHGPSDLRGRLAVPDEGGVLYIIDGEDGPELRWVGCESPG